MKIHSFQKSCQKFLGAFLIFALLFYVLPINSFLVKAEEEDQKRNEEIFQALNTYQNNIRSFKIQPGHEINLDEFFTQYKDKFQLTDHDTFKSFHKQAMNGYELERVQQYYKGLEVIGGQYILKLQNSKIVAGNGKIASTLEMDTEPVINEEKALEVALGNLQNTVFPWTADPENYEKPQGKLAIFSKDFSFRSDSMALVYKFTVPVSSLENYVFLIDAKSGKILSKTNNIVPLNETNITVPQLQTVFNGQQNVELVQYNDDGNPQNKHKLERLQSFGAAMLQTKCEDAGQTYDYIDENLDGDFTDTYPACHNNEGVSVHWATDKTLDYFYSKFGWPGLDPGGTYILNSKLTSDPNSHSLGAAFIGYEPAEQKANFIYYSLTEATDGPYVDIDTVAHELTHGVTLLSMQIQPAEYNQYCETASLGEGIADIFGVLVEQEVTGNPNHWLIGDQSNPSGARDISNPLIKTYEVAPYTCEVGQPAFPHLNGGIAAYWFYLLVNGGNGTNGNGDQYRVFQIPKDKAEKILFKTITEKLTAGEGFVDLRHDTLEAAEELYPGDWFIKRAVTDAWYAVGVGDSYEQTLHTTPVDGAGTFWDNPLNENSPNPLDPQNPWGLKLEAQPINEYVTSVEVEISTDENFPFGQTKKISLFTPVSNNPLIVTHNNPATINLKPNTQYYWRVKPAGIKWYECSANGHNEFCEFDYTWGITRTFKTDKRLGQLQYPGGIGDGQGTIINCDSFASPPEPCTDAYPWTTLQPRSSVLNGALEYTMQISKDLNIFTQIDAGAPFPPTTLANGFMERKSATADFSGISPMILPVNIDQYYVRMRVKGPSDFITVQPTYSAWYANGVWSPENNAFFATSWPRPYPEEPADDMPNDGMPPKVSPFGLYLKVNELPGVAMYDAELAEDNGFVQQVPVDDDGPDGQLDGKVNLNMDQSQDGKTFYWRFTPHGPAPFNELGRPSLTKSFIVDYSLTKTKLIKPTDFVPFKEKKIKFYWEKVEKAENYRIEVYKKSDGTSVWTTDVSGVDGADGTPELENSVYVEGPDDTTLSEDTSGYCWTITAIGPPPQNITGITSDEACYELGPDKPINLTPSGGASVSESSVALTWTSEHAPAGYDIDFWRIDGNQPTLLFTEHTDPGVQSLYVDNLAPDIEYQWQVTGLDDFGNKTLSDLATFIVVDPDEPINSDLAFVLTEESNDDFDLIIYTPDGHEIHYYDTNNYVQDTVNDEGPDIAYFDSPTQGIYTVYVHIYNKNNDLVPTASLKVYENGVLKQTIVDNQPATNAYTGQIYGPATYTYPYP